MSMLFAAFSFLLAQRVITGEVKDVNGMSLIGASVLAKGTTVGTITDIDGTFELRVPEGSNALIVSYTGYNTQEVPIGASNTINVTMQEGVTLESAVVTALGVERERKELGYAVTTIQGKELTQVRNSNVTRNLSGRVPGVRVNSSSGTAGGGLSVQIRGVNSFGGASPLFVVDGVPISNSSFNGNRSDIISGGSDFGNRASDIDPDNIESISVLKGASAVNLYGQRGRDGVILITTKKAKKSGINVELSSSVRFANPLVLPEYQNEYATGNFGQYDPNNFVNGWGPKISDVQGQEFQQFPFSEQNPPSKLIAYPDNVQDFFDTGVTLINSAAIGSRSEKGDIRFSYSNFNQTGIVPGNEFNRHNFNVNAGTSLSERLRARVALNYVRSEGVNRPRQGSNSPNLTINQAYTIPRTTDVETLRDNILDEDGIPYSLDGNGTSNNPFHIIENNPSSNELNRIFGAATLDYDLVTPNRERFVESWTATARLGLDVFNEFRRDITSKNTRSAVDGRFQNRDIYESQFNTDIITKLRLNLSDRLKITPLLGWNTNQRDIRRSSLIGADLVAANLYNPANARSVNTTQTESIHRIVGVYSDFGFAWDDYLFLNLSARNDWSSTLPKRNNSYFYPGANLSFVFTEAFDIKSDVLSFGKFRGSIASVGSDVDPYSLSFLYLPLNDVFTQYVADNTFPFGGQPASAGPDVLPPGDNLQPQNQQNIELGTELQFYKGRLGLDFTYYETKTDRQILDLLTAQSTGFESTTINAGSIKNSGIEVLLNLVPIEAEKFRWSIATTYTRNRQKVLDIPEEVEGSIGLTSGFSGLSIRAEEGESFGIYGNGWLRNDNGDIIINESNGLRRQGERTRLGNILPDYQFGVSNDFSIGPVQLGFLIEGSIGGVLFSRTVSGLRGAGLALETADNREGTFIDKGVLEVIEGSDTSYVQNNVPVASMQDFWTNYTDNSTSESSIFDASYVKLREVYFSYNLPKRIYQKSGITNIAIGLEASNLLLLYSNVPHIDPESSFFGPSLAGGTANVEFWSVPTSRSIGFNLKVNF